MRAWSGWRAALGLVLAWLAAGLPALGLAGCAVRPRPKLEGSAPAMPASEHAKPSWAGQSVSWEKLDSIERWLESESYRSDPFWRVEAELQLAEGRLAFAADAEEADTAYRRRTSARTGFLRVRSDPEASASQKRRATSGLIGAGASPREASAPSVDGVLPRSRWGARRPNPARLTRSTSSWSYITVHHSALEGAPAVGPTEAHAVEALRMVQRSHMDGRSYGDVGYHFLIDPAGRIWQGRDLTWQGAHAGGSGGRNNVGNVGICLLGNFDEVKPTRAALAALDSLVVTLRGKFSIPRRNVVGHSDWKGTVCPGRHLLPHVRQLAR